MPPKLLPGYSKADTNNLPYVDIFMLYDFFNSSSLLQPETRHEKTGRSTEAHYGDKAIGYVQLQRENDLVTVRCLFRPQTRVRNDDYIVSAVIRDRDSLDRKKILEVSCKNCSASNAVCKHIIAFVAWLNRRSDEESPTSIACYWKKSSLADIGAGIPFIKASDLVTGRKTINSKDVIPSKNLLESVTRKCTELGLTNCLLFNQLEPQINKLSMHYLIYKFSETCKQKTFNKFIRFLKHSLDEVNLQEVAKNTEQQSECVLWRELRYGRITASKLHEISRCKTSDGCLVKLVLGAKKILDTKYMKRGRELEGPVLRVVEKELKIKINKTGLVLKNTYPLFGSSPDGITENFVFEVKCPGNNDTFKNYMDEHSKPKGKYELQIQLQMFMSNKKTGYFCVARPDFETSKKVEVARVERDDDKLLLCMHDAARFWEHFIYPKLLRSANC